MRYLSSPGRRNLPLIASLAAISLLGCSGGNEVPLFPAQGKLTVAGLPAEGALVTLVPESGGEPDVRPSGRVNAEGVFNIQTYDPDTQATKVGARPGIYVALVTWVPDPTDSNLEMGVRDRLGNRYRNRENSKIRFEIKEGAAELAPIDLPKTDLAY
jgi:hypothetical protein